jgi:hypothetical protein
MKPRPFAALVLLGGLLLTLSPTLLYNATFAREFLSPSGAAFLFILLLPYLVFYFASGPLGRVLTIAAGLALLAVDVWIRAGFYVTQQSETGRLLFIPIPLAVVLGIALIVRLVMWLCIRISSSPSGDTWHAPRKL